MRTKVTTDVVEKRLKVAKLLDRRGKEIGEGIRVPTTHADGEMWFQMMDEFTMDDEPSAVDPTLLQIHIGGTRKAYEELATILLTLARMRTVSPHYKVQLDWKPINSKGTTHFIIH